MKSAAYTARRSAGCYFCLCFMLLAAALRLCGIATGKDYVAAQTAQSSYSIFVARPRGMIYDCNGLPLNNRTKQWMAVVEPTPRAETALRAALKDEVPSTVLQNLSVGKAAVCAVPEKIECEGITCLEVAVPHTADQPAEHTVGYLNAAGHGVSGLEAAYDELLYSEATLQVTFTTDGCGNLLQGESGQAQTQSDTAGSYVMTTLDLSVQEAAEAAALQFDCGAVAVCRAATGELAALVSRPSFDCTDVSRYLNDTTSPLLNRTLKKWSVGSVFKPCVAAAALENGQADYVHVCSGSEQIDGRTFHCHKASGHGPLSLSDGLCYSCNCYFYTLAAQIGTSAFERMASVLNFGADIALAPQIYAECQLPESSENAGEIANLAIGQGSLLLSPISILSLYCAIANGGSYTLPYLVKSFAKGGMVTENNPAPTTAFSAQTAQVLQAALLRVVAEGTGTAAAPASCTAAGKTATAQTGIYNSDGSERTNGWFCGYFPAEAPQYVAVVMIEDAIGGTAAAIFADLADKIMDFSA